MHFSDLTHSKRLERAEGHACVQYAEARRRLFPFEELSPAALHLIEGFFRDRRAPVLHEVSPFAGVAALGMLCTRNYRPIEISNVLYRPVERPTDEQQSAVSVRVTVPDEAKMWSDISAKGWSYEHPELRNFLLDLGTISAAREDSVCFLAEFEGKPGAAGVLCIHDGVALFGGSATVPELLGRGLQVALLHKRMSTPSSMDVIWR